MSKVSSAFGVVATAIVSKAKTILVWIAIIVAIYAVMTLNAHQRDMTVANLSSTDAKVQDAAIMKAAREQKLADALADIQDPNSLPTSDQNVAFTKTRVACATEFTKLVTTNAAPNNLSADLIFGNLYDLHKDPALAPIVTGELATLGEQNGDYLKRLVTNLGDGDPDVRGASGDALATIGGLKTGTLAQSTIDMLKDAVGVAAEKADALTTLGKIGKPAAPVLVTMMQQAATPDFAQSLIVMLATIGDPSTIPAIEQEATATPPDPATRRVALLGLSTIVLATVPAAPSPAPPAAPAAPAKPGAPAAPAAPAPPPGPSPQDIANCMSVAPIFTAALNNPNDDSRDREQCALAIGRLATPACVTALVKALGDIDTRISVAATNGLVSVGPPAIPSLAVAVHDPSENVRIGAATALGSIGTDAAVTAMASTLSDPSADVRRSACQALARSISGNAIPMLATCLSDKDGFVAGAASSSLQMLGKPAVSALVAVLGSANQTAAFYASQALTGFGIDAAPQLRVAAQSGSQGQKLWSAVVLGQIRDPESRVLLNKLAVDPDPKIKYAATQALLQLGGPSA